LNFSSPRAEVISANNVGRALKAESTVIGVRSEVWKDAGRKPVIASLTHFIRLQLHGNLLLNETHRKLLNEAESQFARTLNGFHEEESDTSLSLSLFFDSFFSRSFE